MIVALTVCVGLCLSDCGGPTRQGREQARGQVVPVSARGAIRWQATGGWINDEFGSTASGIGDVNGDGRPDVLIGAPFDGSNGVSAGRVWVLSGVDGSVIRFLDGAPGDVHGSSLDSVGDVDGDGVDDLVSGCAGANNTAGNVLVWSGATGALIHSIDGTVPNAGLGTAVGAAGDVNGDGIPDFAGGAPGAWNEATAPGYVYVYSGADGSVLHSWTGEGPGHRFGFAARSVGDVDLDGKDDIGIGAIKATFNGWRSGRAYVYSGATGKLLHSWDGDGRLHELGHDICDAGDLDGDGRPDILVAADDRTSRSYVRVRSGLDGSIIREFTGFHDFGHSCDIAGDVNGDGVQDYVVGAPSDITHGDGAGAAHLFCGATGATLQVIYGDGPNDDLGYVVRGVNDVNGDGFPDIVAGSSFQDGRPGYARVASVMAAESFGQSSGPIPISLHWHAGPAGNLPLGVGVVSGGTPGTSGTIGFTAGLAPASPLNVCNADIWIDPSPSRLGLISFTFSAQGNFVLPVDLSSPFLGGTTIHAQAITGALPRWSASSGMRLYFKP